jgi:peptidoglycan/xylan/chitin deacetylase (PgdA/CDA1 family)
MRGEFLVKSGKKSIFPKIILLFMLLPLGIPFLIPEIGLAYSGVTYQLIAKEKIVALTFDDGPHPIYTPQILDILDQYQAKATFFMIGSRMEEYPDIAKEVSARGHLIGNHTYTHPDNLRTLSPKELKWEIDQCQLSMQRIAGQNTYLFRPPRGILNQEIIKIVQDKGYTIVLWGICTFNRSAPTPEMMATRVINYAHPGLIVLLHDGRTDFRWKDVVATRLIVENLSRQGYRFVTLEELKPGNKPH